MCHSTSAMLWCTLFFKRQTLVWWFPKLSLRTLFENSLGNLNECFLLPIVDGAIWCRVRVAGWFRVGRWCFVEFGELFRNSVTLSLDNIMKPSGQETRAEEFDRSPRHLMIRLVCHGRQRKECGLSAEMSTTVSSLGIRGGVAPAWRRSGTSSNGLALRPEIRRQSGRVTAG